MKIKQNVVFVLMIAYVFLHTVDFRSGQMIFLNCTYNKTINRNSLLRLVDR